MRPDPATGPAIVAIGGGHGLAASLRALRRITHHLTAVVSVADNGGSTGRLRRSSAQVAPGDLRKCLVALAEPNSALARSMEFRFGEGELDGHAVGNLLLSAMTEVCGGLTLALDELSSLLGVTGRVLPATVEPVDLVAFTDDGALVRGQVAVMGTTGIDRVMLAPAQPHVAPNVLALIEAAELIVLGPGSLFTSVLAATAVPAVTEAIGRADAHVLYVCNLRPQEGETSGYGVDDHVAALMRHGLTPDTVLYDPSEIGGAEGVPGAISARLAATDTNMHDSYLLEQALRAVLERIPSTRN